MKTIFKLIFILINTITIYSQSNENVYIYEKDGKYGYVNNNFEVVIKPIYDEGLGGFEKKFRGKYSIFELNGKYGVFDISENYIIPPIYDFLSYTNSKNIFKFSSISTGKSGLINIDNKEVLKPIYNTFDDEIIITNNGNSFIIIKELIEYNLLNNVGETKIKSNFISGNFDSNIHVFEKNEKYGYVDHNGKEVIKPIYEYASNFNKEKAIVRINEKYGIINRFGELMIKPEYDKISYRSVFKSKNSSSQVKSSSEIYYIKKNNKVGVLDESLEIIVEPIYDEIGCFNEGFAYVSIDKKFGFINEKGILIIPLIYDNAIYFSEGLASVLKEKKWICINSENEIIINSKFIDYIHPFSEGLAVYKQRRYRDNGKYSDRYGYINMKGDIVILATFKKAKNFNNGVGVILQNNDTYYLIDKDQNLERLMRNNPEIEFQN